MLLNPKIQKAIYIATHQHREQKRRGNGIPYIVHPFSVAWLLAEQAKDEDLIAAALLHDVLEDTEGYGYDDIERDFGERVAQIVREVTEDTELPWRERKERYIENLEGASREALMLAAADKIHNLSSMYENILESGTNLFGTEFKPYEDSKWFYESVYAMVEEKLDHEPLVLEFKEVFDKVFG